MASLEGHWFSGIDSIRLQEFHRGRVVARTFQFSTHHAARLVQPTTGTAPVVPRSLVVSVGPVEGGRDSAFDLGTSSKVGRLHCGNFDVSTFLIRLLSFIVGFGVGPRQCSILVIHELLPSRRPCITTTHILDTVVDPGYVGIFA